MSRTQHAATAHFCGLDFGTSNSTIGILHNNACQLVTLENHKNAIRSAIFYDYDYNQLSFGQPGVDTYLSGVPGRLMMALKSILGSSLVQEKTVIYNKLVPYTEVLGHFIAYIKQRAEMVQGAELTQVVLGRPVRFHDDDDQKDRLAQDTLENIARLQGFKEITFQYEPIAATSAYEQSVTTEHLALIVDIGGGTADFTVVRLHPNRQTNNRSRDILSNNGIHIGGTDFDKQLSLQLLMPLLGMHSLMRGSSSDIEVPSSVYHDLTSWHILHQLYTHKTIGRVREIITVAYEKNLLLRLLHVLQHKLGHYILNSIESAKQQLSDVMDVTLDLSFIEASLTLAMNRTNLNQSIAKLNQKLLLIVTQTIQLAGLQPSQIDAIFYTGGSTKIPIIREQINALFPQAKVILGDAFGSVGMGLTLEARYKYG